jgi:diphthine methyl ester synthase
MSIPTAVTQLAEVEATRRSGVLDSERTLAVAVSRLGSPTDQRFVCGTLKELADLGNRDPAFFGKPLHSLVIVGKRLHHLEVEFAEEWAVNSQTWRENAHKIYGVQLGD